MRTISPSEFEQLIRETATLLGTKTRPVIIPGEAILGIEALARCVSCPGRRFLNIVTGPYGAGFGDWLREGGSEVEDLITGYDEVIEASDVRRAIERARAAGTIFDCLAYIHTEAITGGVNPARELQELAREENLLTILDSVSAIGADPFFMDEWNVDFVSIGLQKALSGPNGISMLGISERGMEWIRNNPRAPKKSIFSIPEMYEAQKNGVPENLPTLECAAALEALQAANREGLARIEQRHREAMLEVRAKVQALGYALWQKTEEGCSSLDTTVVRPDTKAARAFTGAGIVTEGNGELKEKVLRINHYGCGLGRKQLDEAYAVLEEIISK